MRHRLSAVVGVLLIGACICDTATAETGSPWWPFGRSEAEESLPPAAAATDAALASTSTEQAEQQAPSSQITPVEEPEQKWMIDSPLAKVSWPRFKMPEVPTPRLPDAQLWPKKSQSDSNRNAWLAPDSGAKRSSPLEAMTSGARRVADGSRTAWSKTVDLLTPGERSRNSSRVARRDTQPPWWKRMFAAEDQQPEGPQTVTEWMAQERLDP